jgi:ammonia channel protein AmtB
MANIIQVVGLVAITAGATLIAIPAGLIVGGIACVLLGISLERN